MFPLLLAASLAALLYHVEAVKYTNVALVGGGMGMGGMGMGGMGMGMGGMGGMGMGMGMGGFEMDESMFNGGKKNMNDMFFNEKGGKEGGQFGMGKKGFQAGEGKKKMLKGEQGAYNGFNAGKKMIGKEMGYNGGQKFGKEGKKGDQKKKKEGHKKGHGIKSYKTSHEKNENSQNEEFYDEEHDEGDKVGYNGQKGMFGENKGSGFKGAQGAKEFKAGEEKKGGSYGNKYLQDAEKGEGGQYGNKKYLGQQGGYVANTEGDLKKGGGHEEAQKMFKHYKHPMMMGR